MFRVVFAVFLALTSLHGALVSKPPHSAYLSSPLKYDHIISSNEQYKQRILERVFAFPVSNYDIYSVHNLGLFLLDAKSDWIKDVLKRDHEWEGYLAPLIKKYVKPNTVVLDVGAHIGTHTLTLSRAVGPNGKVIAFEPQPKSFCELFMNTEINQSPNIYCFWAALGDRTEELKLPKFHPEVEVIYILDSTYPFGKSEDIAPMIPLDSLDLTNVSFMKVDVDGCDDIFLDGAKNTILRNRPVIIMEILGGADIDTATPEQKQMILHTKKKIADLGYSLYRVSVHDYLCLPNY
jgi:FkbM family methyltransferase